VALGIFALFVSFASELGTSLLIFLRNFAVRVVQDRKILPLLDFQAQNTFAWIGRGNSEGTGARLILAFDAAKISTLVVTEEVAAPDGPSVVADFDLACSGKL
jgi:hypothetical protein